MKVTGQGTLQHGFYGQYVATVVITFADGPTARDVACTLGGRWELRSRSVVWVGRAEDGFDAMKADLRARHALQIVPCGYSHCRGQCRDAEIDNVNHSIDVGARFTVEVEVVPAEQLILIGPGSK